MMLGLSMNTKGQEVDLQGIMAGAEAVDDRVPHGKLLAAFAEAVIAGSDADLVARRAELIEAVGGDGFVDAACVVGNFERMARIADATGVPLDDAINEGSVDLRDDLGLNSFAMAGRTTSQK